MIKIKKQVFLIKYKFTNDFKTGNYYQKVKEVTVAIFQATTIENTREVNQMSIRAVVRPLASVAVMLGLPIAVNAGIVGSAHDFSTQGWSGGEICIACHTPHHADNSAGMPPLWNHTNTTATYTPYDSDTFNKGAVNLDQFDATGAPDPLGNGYTGEVTTGPSADYVVAGPASRVCLSCHDGTVALDAFGGQPGSSFIGGSKLIGTDLSDDHPIGIDWMHQTELPGCNIPDGCHELGELYRDASGNVDPTGGISGDGYLRTQAAIDVFVGLGEPAGYSWPRDSRVTNPRPARLAAEYVSWWYGTPDGSKTGPGPGLKVECPSCHEVHGSTGWDYLLRDTNASSKLCRRCHGK